MLGQLFVVASPISNLEDIAYRADFTVALVIITVSAAGCGGTAPQAPDRRRRRVQPPDATPSPAVHCGASGQAPVTATAALLPPPARASGSRAGGAAASVATSSTLDEPEAI